MAHDAERGVAPPDFLLDIYARPAQAQPDSPPPKRWWWRRSRVAPPPKGLGERYGRDAAAIYGAARAAGDRAPDPGGARRTRGRRAPRGRMAASAKGGEFYATALQTTTTTRHTPDEVHRIGLDQAAEISARLDGLLKSAGAEPGRGRRADGAPLRRFRAKFIRTPTKASATRWPTATDRLDAIRTRLPASLLAPADLRVRSPARARCRLRRVRRRPSARDLRSTARGPGLVYFNLHDRAEWPKFCLATTVFHEGLPGHQLEGGLALSNTRLPLIRKAERVLRVRRGLGALRRAARRRARPVRRRSARAARLPEVPAVPRQPLRRRHGAAPPALEPRTGDRPISSSRTARLPGFATREVERYCATPGQACSYKLGHTVFTGLRTRAKARLGARFDLKAFHDAVLNCGRVPLEILQGVGDDWMARQA